MKTLRKKQEVEQKRKETFMLQNLKAEILTCLADSDIAVKQIILFGSRVKDACTENSDWDFLIVVKKTLTRQERMEIAHTLRRKFAARDILCDVLVRSENEVQLRKNVLGSVIRAAVEEGVPL